MKIRANFLFYEFNGLKNFKMEKLYSYRWKKYARRDNPIPRLDQIDAGQTGVPYPVRPPDFR